MLKSLLSLTKPGVEDEAYDNAESLIVKKPFPSTEEELKEVFEKIDLDKSGEIDFDEIRVLLRQMDKTFTEKDIVEILQSLDLDGAGLIKWAEFKRIFGMNYRKAE